MHLVILKLLLDKIIQIEVFIPQIIDRIKIAASVNFKYYLISNQNPLKIFSLIFFNDCMC